MERYTQQTIDAILARDNEERQGPLIQFSHHEHISGTTPEDKTGKTLFYYRNTATDELRHMVSYKFTKAGGFITNLTMFSTYKGV